MQQPEAYSAEYMRRSEQICDVAEDEIRGNFQDETIRGLIKTGLLMDPNSNGGLYQSLQGNGSAGITRAVSWKG